MRSIYLVPLFVLGCGSDPAPADDTFTPTGGTVDVPNCGYSFTTRMGAEPLRMSGTKVGTDPTPRLVHLGIVGDPKTSIVAQWRTTDDTTTGSVIRYGAGANLPEAQLTQTLDGLQFGYKSTGTQIFRMHQAHLCNLQPGTTYSYQVGTTGHFSPVYTFHTAPDIGAHPDAEVTLGYVGDSRGGQDVWAQVVSQLQQRTPDLMLFSGDATTVGIAQPEWEDFLGNAEKLFATIPVIMVNGNHENNAINFFSQFALPGDQENYGIDYGFAHVTVANDTPDDPATLTTTIRDSIAADFEASKAAQWKMLLHHRPMWSSGTLHGSDLTLQASWQPLVDQYHLDLVLNGHEHQFEITKPLLGQAIQPTNATGTVYVIAGGAGADLYPTGTVPWDAYAEMTHSAAVIHVRRNMLTLDSFRPDGTAIPTGFSKTKP
ncbi:MAG: Purple acid phosphatase [Myxococcales bacterium]|nr:Purple acid phosphatase [Myxococcales bacterium]